MWIQRDGLRLANASCGLKLQAKASRDNEDPSMQVPKGMQMVSSSLDRVRMTKIVNRGEMDNNG